MSVVSASGQPLGVVEWFRPGDEGRVEAALERLRRLGIGRLRTHLSWADFHADGGAWYDTLFPRLGRQVEVLPCVHYTPPSLSVSGRCSGPPRRARDYADFIDVMLDRYGRWFEWVEIWNEPNNLNDWDWRADPDWQIFCEMAGAAAYWARRRGWKTVLGGPCPTDLNWLRLMAERGVLAEMDAVGLHGFPGTWESTATLWRPWPEQAGAVRGLLDEFGLGPEIWLTEVGYSSWRHDPARYLHWFLDSVEAPVERVYWYMLEDIDPALPTQDGLQFDPRHYHFGLYDAQGAPKLAARLLEKDGLRTIRRLDLDAASPAFVGRSRPVLITGGAGFIGSNLADSFAADGRDVLIFDALHRPGVEENLDWLRDRHPGRVSATIADLRDKAAVDEAVRDAGAVVHLAAQVAVTTSIVSPQEDFDINLRGTMNLLEAARRRADPPPLVFASTNKVYGDLSAHDFRLADGRWTPIEEHLRTRGVAETQPLDFSTPYGCSKGAADQYVLDYAHTFALPAAVLRMSCIYGPRQFGTEDQGWVAHFLIRARSGEPIVLFGDGQQVRDILHVGDAVAAYRGMVANIGKVAGRAFNLGGGPANAVSLLEVLDEIEILLGRPVPRRHAPPRQGDQLYFVADTAALAAAIGWRARTGWREGVRDLAAWLDAARPIPAMAERTAETVS